jgi:hypothetical protein
MHPAVNTIPGNWAVGSNVTWAAGEPCSVTSPGNPASIADGGIAGFGTNNSADTRATSPTAEVYTLGPQFFPIQKKWALWSQVMRFTLVQ